MRCAITFGEFVMPQPDRSSGSSPPPSPTTGAEPRAGDNSTDERAVSKPGGFKNDPDDAKNPNEAIERHRRKVRPNGPA
jgi:hypothetical protein